MPFYLVMDGRYRSRNPQTRDAATVMEVMHRVDDKAAIKDTRETWEGYNAILIVEGVEKNKHSDFTTVLDDGGLILGLDHFIDCTTCGGTTKKADASIYDDKAYCDNCACAGGKKAEGGLQTPP